MPAYFPSKQATRSFDGWAYRYCPETGIYVAVIRSGVYVLGGAFGTEVMRLGEITQFVGQPPTRSGPPLAASMLGQCFHGLPITRLLSVPFRAD
jgi:hypothetical protein